MNRLLPILRLFAFSFWYSSHTLFLSLSLCLSSLFLLLPFRSRFSRLVLCFCWRQKLPRNFRFRRRHLDFPRPLKNGRETEERKKKRFRKMGFFIHSATLLLHKPLLAKREKKRFMKKCEKTLQFHYDSIVKYAHW